MADRESIVSALAALVFGAQFPTQIVGQSTWLMTSRRLRLWGDVPPTSQPAAFLVEHRETDEYQGRGQLQRRFMSTALWCYFRTDSPAAVGGQMLNVALSAIEAALAPDDLASGALTLGGQVSWCRIEGEVFKDPGDIDNQAMMIVPIRTLWP